MTALICNKKKNMTLLEKRARPLMNLLICKKKLVILLSIWKANFNNEYSHYQCACYAMIVAFTNSKYSLQNLIYDYAMDYFRTC